MQQGTDILVGQVLAGTYRVERLLGRGGMGAVYAASHLRLPTRSAIKVLHAETAANTEIFARFQREAEITSALRHPNIVQVFDFNRLPDGPPYLVMEFLEGEDLHARLRRVGRMSYEEVLGLLRAVGAGLTAAHKKGVVHRDLKPQNIFLARVEQGDEVLEIPKIVDFGISKMRHAPTDMQHTREQQLLGTPNYMSPEQARGDNAHVDARTDQWALAAIAYQCLTGRLAFAGDTLAGIIYSVVLSEPAPLRTLVPELPAHAEEAIRRALAKDREARFPSVLDLVRAFAGQPLTGQAGAASAASQRGDHPLLVTPSLKPTTEVPGASLPMTAPASAAGERQRDSMASVVGNGEKHGPPEARRYAVPVAVACALLLALGISGLLLRKRTVAVAGPKVVVKAPEPAREPRKAPEPATVAVVPPPPSPPPAVAPPASAPAPAISRSKHRDRRNRAATTAVRGAEDDSLDVDINIGSGRPRK